MISVIDSWGCGQNRGSSSELPGINTEVASKRSRSTSRICSSDNLEAPVSITFDDIDDAELECVREGLFRSGAVACRRKIND